MTEGYTTTPEAQPTRGEAPASSANNINDMLPTSLLHRVFEKLSPRDLCLTAGVCKPWARVCKQEGNQVRCSCK